MVVQDMPLLLSLSDLARRCTEESDHFFARRQYDPSFCYELFRRALAERNETAWRLVFNQYRPLVASWVERQQAFPLAGEEVDFFINGAFARLMKAVSPEQFARFQDLRSILGYLQLCVVSEVNDHMRAIRGTETLPLDQVNLSSHMAPDDVENTALDDVERTLIWQTIRSCTKSDSELLVVYASYVLGLKPRQLYERFPDRFDSVDRVYRIKENVLARLRRDPRMQSLFEEIS